MGRDSATPTSSGMNIPLILFPVAIFVLLVFVSKRLGHMADGWKAQEDDMRGQADEIEARLRQRWAELQLRGRG